VPLQGRAIVAAIAIGIGATAVMDLWNLFLRRAFGIPSLDYCLLGRWVAYIPAGIVRHASIASAAAKPNECTMGWIAHYSIGIGLAVAFVILLLPGWLARPTVLPALLYGLVTVVFPFFILQPSLGFGVASSRAAKPTQARLKSLATHGVFGLGLYLAALAVQVVGRLL
jgi:Protein of unknown function (DUF2938)